MLKDAKWVMNIKEFDISGCKYIDADALQVLLDIESEYKHLNNSELPDDFKHFFIEKDDGTFQLSKDVKQDPKEVY